MRLAVLLIACLGLAGCSDADWANLMTFSDDAPRQDIVAAAPEAAPAPEEAAASSGPAAPDASFCQAVAVQDATSNAFDQATQARVAAQSFKQCVAVFGAH